MSRLFVLTALTYAILGLALGIHMAASHNHGQLVTHAHILLAGFVVTFIYALCHKLWLADARTLLAKAQFAIHQIGILVLSAGLFLLYGQFVNPESIDPVLAAASIAVLIGMILMTLQMFKTPKTA